MKTVCALVLACVLLAGCGHSTPRALGTLEWDRITLPAPAAEKIIAIEVREGEAVPAGKVLVRLEANGTQSQLAAAAAEQRRSDAALAELKAGPRREEIARAQAALNAAQAQQVDAAAQLKRLEELVKQKLIPQADVDRARAAADSAAAQVRSAQAALLELTRGTRGEQIAQGAAAVQAATAQTSAQRVLFDKLTLVAPRAGVIDNLPYKLGDQAPVGAPLVVMLAGDAPYARVYVPEALRAGVKAGTRAQVHVEGNDHIWSGTVRMIRSDPTFTPYYALTGQDVSRLSYLAEVQLAADARDLPAGLPLWVEFTP
ncbi:MAG TPA: HlyD family efflux transporter periplasmic adaptor subunit [Steroidobacteraceae bacterium]|nr:HlyD family efflux transporter periplasmic adaptor subunit [Steroidobacteraceae bacterium]